MRYLELESKTTLNSGKQNAQWFGLAFLVVALVFLVTTVIGLLGRSAPLARAMLMVNLLAMVWIGVGTLDIIQHLFPDAIKGGEIHTAKWVKVTAQVVAADAAALLIPAFSKMEPWVYVLVIGLVIVAAYSTISETTGEKK
jgi:hypothetical protein